MLLYTYLVFFFSWQQSQNPVLIPYPRKIVMHGISSLRVQNQGGERTKKELSHAAVQYVLYWWTPSFYCCCCTAAVSLECAPLIEVGSAAAAVEGNIIIACPFNNTTSTTLTRICILYHHNMCNAHKLRVNSSSSPPQHGEGAYVPTRDSSPSFTEIFLSLPALYFFSSLNLSLLSCCGEATSKCKRIL